MYNFIRVLYFYSTVPMFDMERVAPLYWVGLIPSATKEIFTLDEKQDSTNDGQRVNGTNNMLTYVCTHETVSLYILIQLDGWVVWIHNVCLYMCYTLTIHIFAFAIASNTRNLKRSSFSICLSLAYCLVASLCLLPCCEKENTTKRNEMKC